MIEPLGEDTLKHLRRMMRENGQPETVPIYVSHSALKPDRSVEWFIVEPRNEPDRQVESLVRSGRAVYVVSANAWSGASQLESVRRLELTEEEKEMLAQALTDYREGVEKNCEDEDRREQLIDILDSLDWKLGL